MAVFFAVILVESAHASWAAGNLRKRELQLQEEKRDITILGIDSSDLGDCDSDGDCDDGEGAMADPSDNLSDESLVEDEGDDLDQDEVSNHWVLYEVLSIVTEKTECETSYLPQINSRSPGTRSPASSGGPATSEEPPSRGAPGQAEEPPPQRQGFGRQRQQARP